MSTETPTRTRILNSAYALFIEKGYHGCSMRGIAKAAGLRPASIYNHFDNKEQIFESVFSERHPMFRILSILEDVEGDDVEELLTNAVQGLHVQLENEPGLLNLFFIELVEMDGKHIPEAIRSHFPRNSRILEKIFNRSGEIRRIREPVLLRSLISFVLSYVLFNWFIGDGDSKAWGSLSELTDVYLRGVLTD